MPWDTLRCIARVRRTTAHSCCFTADRGQDETLFCSSGHKNMTRLPFLRPGRPEDVIAWCASRPVTRRKFLRDLAALASRLPDRPYVLNHCEDRYQFLSDWRRR